MNQIINMIVRQVMRQLINRGLNAGFDKASKVAQQRGGKAPRQNEMMTRAEQQQVQQAKRRAKQSVKAMRRLS